MKKLWFVFPLAAAGTALTVLSPNFGFAFDHADAPATRLDNAADIADVFAFMRPVPDGDGGFLSSTHLVMIMTFAPGAAAGQRFDSAIDYVFRVRGSSSLTGFVAPNVKVTCNFTNSTPQKVLCNANGTLKLSDLEPSDAGALTDDVRVWAGRASDPAFADVDAIRDTVAMGQNKLRNPGVNKFTNANVAAIVVEVSVANVLNKGVATPATSFAVGGEALRN